MNQAVLTCMEEGLASCPIYLHYMTEKAKERSYSIGIINCCAVLKQLTLRDIQGDIGYYSEDAQIGFSCIQRMLKTVTIAGLQATYDDFAKVLPAISKHIKIEAILSERSMFHEITSEVNSIQNRMYDVQKTNVNTIALGNVNIRKIVSEVRHRLKQAFYRFSLVLSQ